MDKSELYYWANLPSMRTLWDEWMATHPETPVRKNILRHIHNGTGGIDSCCCASRLETWELVDEQAQGQ